MLSLRRIYNQAVAVSIGLGVLFPLFLPLSCQDLKNFDFSSLSDSFKKLPELKNFLARDNALLSFRYYPARSSSKILIMLHGSAYHSAYLHQMGSYLSENDITSVCLPNIRGHYKSGNSRGECSYIGQLEDDVFDLIKTLRLENQDVYLGGHSSGGGLAIRFAGSKYRDEIKGFLLFTPFIPFAKELYEESAVLWANVSVVKIITLNVLNFFGMKFFNNSVVVSFNMPDCYKDGTETLSYSYNLNTAMHPGPDYMKDVQSLGDDFLLLVGDGDEMNSFSGYKKIFNDPFCKHVKLIPQAKHLDIVKNEEAYAEVKKWLQKQ